MADDSSDMCPTALDQAAPLFPDALTIDVEDWFHILDTSAAPRMAQWDQLESRIERNMLRMLDLLAEAGVRGTFFWLGWAARRHPGLVRRCVAAGHEIASHGYGHLLAYQAGPRAYLVDLLKARKILEDITGQAVRGFRAPGFGITDEAQWAFEVIVEAGYTYDSSVFPAARGHGGMTTDRLAPHRMSTPSGSLVEVPMSVVEWLGRRAALFGGGYLRLAPWWLIRKGIRHLHGHRRPLIVYLHPREIDPDQPRLPLTRARAFRSYVNLRTTLPKLRALCGICSPAPLGQSIAAMPAPDQRAEVLSA